MLPQRVSYGGGIHHILNICLPPASKNAYRLYPSPCLVTVWFHPSLNGFLNEALPQVNSLVPPFVMSVCIYTY